MKREDRLTYRIDSGKLCVVLAAIVALCAISGICAIATPNPWWDCLPRYVSTSVVQTAINYHANMVMCGAGTDPGWGPWFTSDGTSSDLANHAAFAAVGAKSLSYTEGFGTATAPLVSINPNTVPATQTNSCWSWNDYNGTDQIEWAGAWTWFDDASWCRPLTRTGPTYGGSPMTYPNGTVATGFLNNNPADPRNSEVYDAGCAADIFGNLWIEDYGYVSPPNITTGMVYIPTASQYMSNPAFSKDAACPCWADYARASTMFACATSAADGTWCDNVRLME